MLNNGTNITKWVLDRIENNLAILENEHLESINLPLNTLPANCKEGDCLWFDGQSYHNDEMQTKTTQQRIQQKFNRLRKN